MAAVSTATSSSSSLDSISDKTAAVVVVAAREDPAVADELPLVACVESIICAKYLRAIIMNMRPAITMNTILKAMTDIEKPPHPPTKRLAIDSIVLPP
jgi:hypothetical protein